MAKTVTRKWENVVETIAEESGMPKQQIVQTMDAFNKGVQSELTKYQPKRDGDILEVITPAFKGIVERVPEEVITDASGQKFTRPSCCVFNMGIPSEFINAANAGLVDDAAIEKTA